jgi:4-hydroxy-3-polyprenylbenzoate decarboxylase
MLKERRKLILMTRETPLNLIQIENMKGVTLAGGIICPANPSFYCNPQNMDDLLGTVVSRILNLSGFESNARRWGDYVQE